MSSQDLFRCHWCAALGDSLAADWCSCAGDRRSLVCSHCGQCICRASAEVNHQFWTNASAALLARRETYADPVARSPAVQLSGPVVLVVDDDRLVHAIVDRVMLGFEGVLVHAHNGTEALRLARHLRPDLILTDALLPGVDGRELSKAVKTDPALSSTTVVVMTALYKGPRYRHEAFTEYLVDGYVEKPLSALKLRSVIEGALELRIGTEESSHRRGMLKDIAS